MPQGKTDKPNELLSLKLTAAERRETLIAGQLPQEIQARIQETGPRKPVLLTLQELAEVLEVVELAVEDAETQARQNKLNAIAEKIEALTESDVESDPDTSVTPKAAAAQLAVDMRDELSGKNSRRGDSKIISFRLKQPLKQNSKQKFPLKLTEKQRKAVALAPRLTRALKRRLQDVERGTHVMTFSEKELVCLRDELSEAACFASSPDKQKMVAVLKKVEDLLDEIRMDAIGLQLPKKRIRPRAKQDVVFQFKITLAEIAPPIWRRILVRDCKLGDLHVHIQAAFGWWDDHLHEFRIDGQRFGPPPPKDLGFWIDEDLIDETKVSLSELLPESGQRTRWRYVYDFGDNWEHEVLFEGYPVIDRRTKLPLCVDGECACPPEDCGGPWGFVDYINAISDPKHARHAEYLEWRGPLDCDEFDAQRATKEMRKFAR